MRSPSYFLATNVLFIGKVSVAVQGWNGYMYIFCVRKKRGGDRRVHTKTAASGHKYLRHEMPTIMDVLKTWDAYDGCT